MNEDQNRLGFREQYRDNESENWSSTKITHCHCDRTQSCDRIGQPAGTRFGLSLNKEGLMNNGPMRGTGTLLYK